MKQSFRELLKQHMFMKQPGLCHNGQLEAHSIALSLILYDRYRIRSNTSYMVLLLLKETLHVRQKPLHSSIPSHPQSVEHLDSYEPNCEHVCLTLYQHCINKSTGCTCIWPFLDSSPCLLCLSFTVVTVIFPKIFSVLYAIYMMFWCTIKSAKNQINS